MVKSVESEIENVLTDEQRKAWLDNKARPDGFIFNERKIEETNKKESNKDV